MEQKQLEKNGDVGPEREGLYTSVDMSVESKRMLMVMGSRKELVLRTWLRTLSALRLTTSLVWEVDDRLSYSHQIQAVANC